VPWVENAPIPLQPASEMWSNACVDGNNIDQARVDHAIAEWRRTPKGHGNEAFFRLALECKRAGMNANQLEELLIREAQSANSPAERKIQIAGIMESLSKGPVRA